MSIADYGFAIWETFYVTVLSTAFALVLGLPLGVLLVAGDKDGILPLPGWLMHILNIVINILRSVPFLILMICVFPLTRAIVGTTVGTKATIVPLVVAAFPFVARLVETSLRELDEGVVEAAQSMGATPFQIITKVMIPECLPGLISSMTTALREERLGEKGGAFFNGKEGRDDFRKNISFRRLRGKRKRIMHNFNDIQIIIMAGGVGSRFWPMSTPDYPK